MATTERRSKAEILSEIEAQLARDDLPGDFRAALEAHRATIDAIPGDAVEIVHGDLEPLEPELRPAVTAPELLARADELLRSGALSPEEEVGVRAWRAQVERMGDAGLDPRNGRVEYMQVAVSFGAPRK